MNRRGFLARVLGAAAVGLASRVCPAALTPIAVKPEQVWSTRSVDGFAVGDRLSIDFGLPGEERTVYYVTEVGRQMLEIHQGHG